MKIWKVYLVLVSLLTGLAFGEEDPHDPEDPDNPETCANYPGIFDFRPSQTEVGFFVAAFKEEVWFHKWRESSLENTSKEITEYSKFLSIKAMKKKYPAVKDPQGQLYLTDKHHYMMSLAFGYKRILDFLSERKSLAGAEKYIPKINPKKIVLRRDFTREENNLEGFFQDYFGLDDHSPYIWIGNGFFPEEFKALNPESKMSLWPKTIWNIRDNPLRSLMGFAFKEFELDGADFEDYVQFYVGEAVAQLIASGKLPLPTPQDLPTPHHAGLFLWEILFQHEEIRELLYRYLRKDLKPEKSWIAKVERALEIHENHQKALQEPKSMETLETLETKQWVKRDFLLKVIGQLKK